MTMKYLTTIVIAIGLNISLQANPFPKCEAACNKYFNCVVENQPQASEQQRDLLKRGCDVNCNKAKYYPKIEKCYDKAQGSCQTYWNCITKAFQ